MSNLIPFPPRTPPVEPRVARPVLLYHRLSVTRAKALGMCPDPANDTRTRGSRASRHELPAENGKGGDDGLASLLELSIRALVESRTAARGL